VVIRYMGTKRHMASHVRRVLVDLRPSGRVVDLFSGMGSVAQSLADQLPIVTNDSLSFTSALSRARFTGPSRTTSASEVIECVWPLYFDHSSTLSKQFEQQLVREQVVLASTRADLVNYMIHAPHVGNKCERFKAAL